MGLSGEGPNTTPAFLILLERSLWLFREEPPFAPLLYLGVTACLIMFRGSGQRVALLFADIQFILPVTPTF